MGMNKKFLIVVIVSVWLTTMGYLLIRTIEETANLVRNLFPEQVYLENTQQIPNYLSQVGIIIGYICFAIILLSITICGLYLGLKKIFVYWKMIEE